MRDDFRQFFVYRLHIPFWNPEGFFDIVKKKINLIKSGWLQAGGGILKYYFLTLIFIFHISFLHSQEIWITEPFIQTQGRLNKDGAIGLSSWAILNAGYSGYQISRTTGQEYHFHKMNLIWSGIDLAIGIPTFIRSHRIYKGKVQLKLDKYNPKKYLSIYSLNSWLDVAYIATGFIVKSRASHSSDPNMLKGYGNSIIMQGGFLFSFDTVMYLLHRKLYKNHVKNSLKSN